jgi:hypothetical protein
MITRIKYEDPANHGSYIIEELDDSVVDVPEYCSNLHRNHLCNTTECDGEHCKIWVEVDGEFFLAGVAD